MAGFKFFQPEQSAQAPNRRVKNFQEISSGLSRRAASAEAKRCPQCSQPVCRTACPLGIDIPGFIKDIRGGDAAAALARIKESNPSPHICGRICPAPCEKACVLSQDASPIAIRALERYASDCGHKLFAPARRQVKATGKKVAIVGSGPSGLTAAQILVLRNYQVTVFDAMPVLGGVLRYGIPRFRLPDKILKHGLDELTAMGVEFRPNQYVGHSLSIEDIFGQGFAVIVLAVGTGGAHLTNLSGANLSGVYYAEEFLMEANLLSERVLRERFAGLAGKRCVVIGKNYSAMDCARVCRRFTSEVTLIVDGPDSDLAIHPDDWEQGREEGVKISAMTQALEIMSPDGIQVGAVKCATLDYADPHSTGQWELLPVPETDQVIDTDVVIVAQGHRRNTALPRTIPGLRSNENGTIWFAQKQMTSLAHVLVAGDAATGVSTVVQALASGKWIAQTVDNYLTQG